MGPENWLGGATARDSDSMEDLLYSSLPLTKSSKYTGPKAARSLPLRPGLLLLPIACHISTKSIRQKSVIVMKKPSDTCLPSSPCFSGLTLLQLFGFSVGNVHLWVLMS